MVQEGTGKRKMAEESKRKKARGVKGQIINFCNVMVYIIYKLIVSN
jgi:hypothetical protein